MASSSDSVSASILPPWLKPLLLSVILLATCWGSAIMFWRTTERTPGTWELGLVLLALPLVALTSLWLIRRLTAQQPAAQAATASKEKLPAAPTSAPALAILAAALRTPHGATPAEVNAAISKQKSSADIDHQLHDDNGYPVMTCRVRDTYDGGLQESMAEWLVQNGLADPGLNDEQWRALTLGASTAGDLSAAAASHIGGREKQPTLQVHLIVPSGWTPEKRRIAGMLLSNAVTRAGWPSTHLSVATDEATVPDAINGYLSGNATESPTVAMVVAFASNIGEHTVAEWAEEGTLFTASNPLAAIPGEGAVGFLVCAPTLARSLPTDFVLMHPVEEAEREKYKKGNANALDNLAERALKRAERDVSDVAMIVADTGQHATNASELMVYVNKALPELDSTDDVVHAGLACGTCGHVPFMTALALACHHAIERNASVLAIGNEDPSHRLAAVISPGSGQPR